MLSKIKEFIYKHKGKIIGGICIIYFGYRFFDEISSIKFSAFIQAIKLKQVHEAIIQNGYIYFRNNESNWYRTAIGSVSIELLHNILKKYNIAYEIKNPNISKDLLNLGILSIFSSLLFIDLMGEINKGPLSKAKFDSTIIKNNQNFDDYYGGENIKIKLKQIIEFLRNPTVFQKMGARIRRGVLFYGPPGTGKTMLARALANQAGCQFIKIVASQFQEIFVGVGAKRVRQLFKSARSCKNGCIIFIDEIDALGSRLNHFHEQKTSTINQFLSQMDGFSPLDKIVIVAATNRKDLVDQAILRAGRFDIKVHIPLPNDQQRRGIFAKLLSTKCKAYDVTRKTMDTIAEQTETWCGADLQNLLNQSIYRAIKQNDNVVREKHILDSLNELKRMKIK